MPEEITTKRLHDHFLPFGFEGRLQVSLLYVLLLHQQLVLRLVRLLDGMQSATNNRPSVGRLVIKYYWLRSHPDRTAQNATFSA